MSLPPLYPEPLAEAKVIAAYDPCTMQYLIAEVKVNANGLRVCGPRHAIASEAIPLVPSRIPKYIHLKDYPIPCKTK